MFSCCDKSFKDLGINMGQCLQSGSKWGQKSRTRERQIKCGNNLLRDAGTSDMKGQLAGSDMEGKVTPGLVDEGPLGWL